MGKIIKILILAAALVWVIPMPTALASEETPPEWTVNHVKGADTAKVAGTAPADTLSQNPDQENASDSTATGSGEDQDNAGVQKKETASSLWYLALIWLIVLTGGIAYIYYMASRRFENHRNALRRLKDDQARMVADKNSDTAALGDRLRELEGAYASLRSENERLRRSVASLDEIVKGLGNPKQMYPDSQKSGRSEKPAFPSGEGNRDEETFYADTLNIRGDGTLSIPLQILKEKDSGELFRITVNLKNGTGTYTLNPKAPNLISQISKLRKFSNGIDSMQGSQITVVEPGILKREGYDLRIVRKLIVKSE